jgi:hypothetical protein
VPGAPLLLALLLASPVGKAPAVLAVPYLPQTEALCGGAAAAMVFRYWGDRRADVQQFAPLVDREAGGIADAALVAAIRERGWRADRVTGSLASLRESIARGKPLILLIRDRPDRYHYVVAVGADDSFVYVHDPTWGPSRKYTHASFDERWASTNFWTLQVAPPDDAVTLAVPPAAESGVAPADHVDEAGPLTLATPPTACDELLAKAVDEINRRGLASADAVLGDVRTRCPEASAPLSELAAVRLAERRWDAAAALAQEALERDRTNEYAWDVLASSRFLRDDLAGALRAWNRIERPQIDLVRIEGLTHTRYALVAEALGLQPNTLLDGDSYRLASRRLLQLPTRLSSRIGYTPDPDGFASVDVTLVERPRHPRSAAEWVWQGAETAINREVSSKVPGWSGQGEVWSVAWRWWPERPRAAFSFAAPSTGRLRGVWRIDLQQEAQSYRAGAHTFREKRRSGGIALADWLAPNLRYEVSAGLDAWDDRRTVSGGIAVERRWLHDRAELSLGARVYLPIANASGFRSTQATVSYRTSTAPRGVVTLVRAGADGITTHGPRGLWPGAGEGLVRAPLLRAHPLLDGGVVAGPAFGRRLAYATVETTRWLDRPMALPIGVALFADAAHASRRDGGTTGRPLQIDAGIGIRIRVPGGDRSLRIDYARGLRGAGQALTIGYAL